MSPTQVQVAFNDVIDHDQVTLGYPADDAPGNTHHDRSVGDPGHRRDCTGGALERRAWARTLKR